MAVAVDFRRARHRYAYMLMRGKNLETGIVTKEEMDVNLTKFKNALYEVTNLNNWHAFMGLFADLRNVHITDESVAYLDDVITTRFSDDYFNLTLPADLMSAVATSLAWFGLTIRQLNMLNGIVKSLARKYIRGHTQRMRHLSILKRCHIRMVENMMTIRVERIVRMERKRRIS